MAAGIRRIAVSGGPGAGKTSVMRAALRRHPDLFVEVPEVATLMFSHVFPKVHTDSQRCAIQRAIFHTQLALEDFHSERLVEPQVLLCDRGTADGGGYWPTGHRAFFPAMDTDWQAELARYDAVLFLESAAVGGHSIRAGNPVRSEDHAEAVALHERLHAVWSDHPRFTFVPHAKELAGKVDQALEALARLMREDTP